MTTTEPDRLKFACAITEAQHSQGLNFPQACRAVLTDWLIWEATGWHSATRAARCGGGDPPESAGFDSFDLDRENSPAWAVDIFDGLSDAEQIEITLSAEDAEIDRRD